VDLVTKLTLGGITMRRLHLEKKGLRGLAISESFTPKSAKSILCGVVMRRDFILDGFTFGTTTIAGDDATKTILEMYENLKRPDVSYVLISGLIISMYNIVDIKKIYESIKIPIIGLTYNDSQGIEESIKHHYPNSFESKIKKYNKMGAREKITIGKTSEVFVRKEGCSLPDVKYLLNELTLQGSIPEPLRVAQLLARSLLRKGLSF